MKHSLKTDKFKNNFSKTVFWKIGYLFHIFHNLMFSYIRNKAYNFHFKFLSKRKIENEN